MDKKTQFLGICILVLAAAVVIHGFFGRYQISAAGTDGARVFYVKIDRLTGNAWMTFGRKNPWYPVGVEKK